MIDEIRNWLGDIASGRIKDERITLSKEQASVFESQLIQTLKENALLKSRVKELESENAHLKAQLVEFQKEEGVDSQVLQILGTVFEHNGQFYVSDLEPIFNLSQQEVQHHVDILEGLGFCQRVPEVDGIDFHEPESVKITPAGRDYWVKHHAKQ